MTEQLRAALSTQRAHEVAVAIHAVRSASLLCREIRLSYDRGFTLGTDDEPVTVADLASQAVILSALGDAFPSDPVASEEDSSLLRLGDDKIFKDEVVRRVTAVRPDLSLDYLLDAIDRGGYAGGREGRFWTVDPVDGTKGYLRNEQYAIAIALVENGNVEVAALGCPNLAVRSSGSDPSVGGLFVAVRGAGSWFLPLGSGRIEAASSLGMGDRLSTFDPPDSTNCPWVVPVDPGHTDMARSYRVAKALGLSQEPLLMDSQAKYASLSMGDVGVYMRLPSDTVYREKIWDHAAGWLLVTEAGGQVTDANGRQLDFGLGRKLVSNVGIVATAGRPLHDRVIAALLQNGSAERSVELSE